MFFGTLTPQNQDPWQQEEHLRLKNFVLKEEY